MASAFPTFWQYLFGTRYCELVADLRRHIETEELLLSPICPALSVMAQGLTDDEHGQSTNTLFLLWAARYGGLAALGDFF